MAENIRVYWQQPQSYGYSKDNIKFFKDKKSAMPYALEMVKELKGVAQDSDDDDAVIIEDIKKDEVIEAWRNENGKIEHFPKGW